MQKAILKTMVVAASSLLALSAAAQNTNTDSPSAQAAASSSSADTMAAAPGSSAHATRSPGRYLGDKAISTKINAKFLTDEDLKSRHIKVRTYKGVVHLSGYTDSQAQADHAVSVAKDTDGVKSVRSTIKVKTPG